MITRPPHSNIIKAFAIMAFTLVSTHAVAEERVAGSTDAVAATVSATPSQTMQVFGDWTLRCEQLPASQEGDRICEVALPIRAQGQVQPVAQIAIAQSKTDASLLVTALLPVNIALSGPLQITGLSNESSLNLEWTRCLPIGCFASSSLSETLLSAWREGVQPLTIRYTLANTQTISLPLSLRGLSQALDALGALEK